MADTTLKIAAQFDIGALENSLAMFQKSFEGMNLSPAIQSDVGLIIKQLTESIKNAKEMMAKGILDPEMLGLKEIEYHMGILFKNLGNKTQAIFNDTVRKLDEDLVDINTKIEAEEKRLKETEKSLAVVDDPAELARKARQETGTSVRASKGQSLETVRKELERLKQAGLESTDAFKFYENLEQQFVNSAKAAKQLGQDKEKTEKKLQKLHEKATKIERDKAKLIADNTNKATQGQLALIPIQEMINTLRKQGYKVSKDISKAEAEFAKNAKASAKAAGDGANTLAKKATAAVSYYVVFNQLKRVLQDTIQTIFKLDKSMTEAAIVTSMNRDEAWKLLGAYQNLARGTGLATSEIAGVVTQFLRQGRSIGDAMKLAEVAAKSAKVASISANDAVNFLTSAVNGFGLAAEQSEQIADKFAAIAARSATSFEELALAMSKVSPTAKSAGVGVDFMMGVIAKGIETTREAPENIGTAFKTIFARMREVTDIGKATEDGMNLNRVEKALASVGVPLRDVSGQFRNLEQVLIDVGDKWNTLTSVEQAYLATALAGSRQQPRLLAIFNDFARTKELIQISAEATGELANQHYEYMQGSEAALTNLKTSWEQLTMAFVDTGAIINAVQGIANVLQFFADGINGVGDSAAIFNTVLIALIGYLALYGTKLMTVAVITTFANLAKLANITLTDTQAKVLNKTSKELKKMTNEQRLAALADIKGVMTASTFTVALKAKTVAIQGATIAFLKLLLVMLPYIAVAIAAVAAIALIAYAFIEASKDASYFSEQVAKNNKELSELNSKERDLKKLVDRFQQLRNQVALTSQEYNELLSLNDQLANYEMDGETFNITRTDVTGKIVIDQGEYERFLKFVEDKRIELLEKNMKTFQSAVKKDLEGVLEDPTLMKVFAKIGYDFGVEFIEEFGAGISENVEAQLKDAASRIGEIFSPEQFTKTTLNSFGQAIDATQKLFGGLFSGLLISAFGKEETVDFEEYREFVESMLTSLKTTFVNLETTIASINSTTDSQLDKTAAIMQAQANAYERALINLNKKASADNWDQETLQQAIQFLGETMYDQAILNDLINEKKIDAKVVAKMSIDLNIEQIRSLFDDIIAIIAEEGANRGLVDDKLIGTLTNRLESAYGLLFSNNAQLLDEGFAQLRSALEQTGKYTEEEIKGIILRVSGMIKTLTTTEVAALLKDQMDLAKKIFDLPAAIAKGDFSTFAELVESYGLDAAQGVLSGNEAALEQFFNKQNQEAINQIDESIAKIVETAKALGRSLTEAEKNEIAALELMRGYYKDIATQQQLRNYRLGQAKELLKEMNDLLTLQNQLMDLGISGGPLFDILNQIARSKEETALGIFSAQARKDLEDLEQFRTVDGYFEADDLVSAQAAIDEALESVNQLINAVTASYNRQKKEVEARYKTEIDAIKDGYNERWSMIDYTNKLADAEEKIIEARRRLMGLAISGVSRGTLEQAQKDLRKLQEERQKIIEQQAMDKAQKELEQQMNDELIQIQEELTEELNELGIIIEGLTNVLLQIEQPTKGPGGRVGGGRGDIGFAEDVPTIVGDPEDIIVPIETLSTDIEINTEATIENTVAITELTETMKNNLLARTTGVMNTYGGSNKNALAQQDFIGINRF